MSHLIYLNEYIATGAEKWKNKKINEKTNENEIHGDQNNALFEKPEY